MRFDLTDLRLFVHVADAASITHGAERANMALASASARIRGMEDTLGTPLLERGRRGVTLTPAGRALLQHARIILQQTERMRGELGDYAHGIKGHVRLLANTSALSEMLPEMLSEFLTAYPNIDIDIEEKPSFDMVEMVSQGLADAGILSDAVDMGDLEVYPFGVDRLVVIVPRGHRFAKRRRIAFEEALREELVGMTYSSALQQYLGHQATLLGRQPKLRVRVNSFDAMGRMVEQGVGISILPESAAERCRKSMALGMLPLTDKWAYRQLVICCRRYADLPVHAQRLIDHLKSPVQMAENQAVSEPA
jgi:DNA-binding transcriptional LysR family regulator